MPNRHPSRACKSFFLVPHRKQHDKKHMLSKAKIYENEKKNKQNFIYWQNERKKRHFSAVVVRCYCLSVYCWEWSVSARVCAFRITCTIDVSTHFSALYILFIKYLYTRCVYFSMRARKRIQSAWVCFCFRFVFLSLFTSPFVYCFFLFLSPQTYSFLLSLNSQKQQLSQQLKVDSMWRNEKKNRIEITSGIVTYMLTLQSFACLVSLKSNFDRKWQQQMKSMHNLERARYFYFWPLKSK